MEGGYGSHPRERFTSDPAEIAVGSAAFVLMAIGIVLITRTAGPIMVRPSHRTVDSVDS
jgi:hypothetical protein